MRPPGLSGTSWSWAQLPAGTCGLPGPVVVTSPWILQVRAPRPRRRGFTRVGRSQGWAGVRTARKLVAEYSDPTDLMVYSGQHQRDFDPMTPVDPFAFNRSEGQWAIGANFFGPDASLFHDHVHRHGQLMLLTGDLQAYWSAHAAGELPSFEQLFPGGTWAAWLPLVVHLYDDGVGTRPP